MCNHPSIIKIYSSFQTQSKFAYLLEYAANHSLTIMLRKNKDKKFSPNDLPVFYSAEILNVLEYLHCKKNISHNHLNLSNLLLDQDYHLKLV